MHSTPRGDNIAVPPKFIPKTVPHYILNAEKRRLLGGLKRRYTQGKARSRFQPMAETLWRALMPNVFLYHSFLFMQVNHITGFGICQSSFFTG